MYSDTAYDTFVRVYALFGKNAPARSSVIFDTLLGNIADVPDECAKYIYDQAQQLDVLPSNMTKFFHKSFETWQSNNASETREKCPDCNGEGGTLYFRFEDGKWWQRFSPCPTCTWLHERLYKSVRPRCYTRRQLEDMARMDATIQFLPPEYKGNVAKFRLDMGLDNLPKNPNHENWFNGFKERFRQGRALARARERGEADEEF